MAETTEEKKNVKTEEVDYDFSAMTEEEFKDTISHFTKEQKSEALNYLWQNYCISDAIEPGSTYKALTIAGAMEDNVISDGDEFYCDGSQTPVEGESPVYCSYRAGHGTVDVKRALAVSCNDALMQIAEKEGPETFDKYQEIFNIGSKTGIDLQGETTGIKYSAKYLHPMELATSSFGQGVTTSMIQMAASFCSVINGGNYYVPHVVKRLLDDDGNVVQDIEPVLVRKTISKEVSDYLRTYLQAVVEEGTGYAAGIEGYTIGGKTGTAEKLPRGNGKYVLSFIGFTPVENPQIMLYVVVDEPNAEGQGQAHATFATGIVKNILSEVLPYMHIGMTEEMTIAEQAEVDAMLTNSIQTPSTTTGDGTTSGDDTAAGDDTATGDDATTEGNAAAGDDTAQSQDGQDNAGSSTYVVDPNTGELIDPATGQPAEMDYGIEGDDTSQDSQNSDTSVTNQ